LETFGINTRQALEVPEIEVSANSSVPLPGNPSGASEDVGEAAGAIETSEERPFPTGQRTGNGLRLRRTPIALIGLALVILALLLLRRFRRRRQTEALPFAAAPGEASPTQSGGPRFVFAGKLDLYLNATPNRRESPPKTFRMLRFGKKRAELPLRRILRKCRIADKFPGSDQIYFRADGQGALQVGAGSDDTVFIGASALAEKQDHVLGQGESVRVHSEDKTQELEVSPRFLYRSQ